MSEDSEARALLERWNEARERCLQEFRESEREIIRDFPGPEEMLAYLDKIFKQSSEGRIRTLLEQSQPFFKALQKVLLGAAILLPSRSLILVAAGAYLVVKKCAEFDSASKRIVSILGQLKHQLWLFHSYSESIQSRESCKEAFIAMLIALIRFWVTSIRFLGCYPRGCNGNLRISDHWPFLDQKFKADLAEIEQAVGFMQQLQNMEASSSSAGRWQVTKAHAEMIGHLPDDDLVDTSFPCFNLPARDNDSLGRSDETDRLRESLTQENDSASRIAVVYGLGGVGKTSLVLNLCHRLKTEAAYQAIFWIDAENKDVLRRSFTQMALRLRLKGASDKSDKDQNFMLVENWLEKTNRSWLLVYDNVDDFDLLQMYLPPDRGSYVVTTRFPAVSFGLSGRIMRLELCKLSAIESLELFNYIRRQRHENAKVENEMAKIKELLDLIDGLPLGVKQMAHFISSKKISIAKFQEKYVKMAKSILDSEWPSGSHTLSTLWGVQFADIKDSDTAKLLGLLSLCSPEKIPRDLFEVAEFSGNGQASWIAFCMDYERVENAITCLQNKALISIEDRKNDGDGDEDEEGLLSIHRLTQEAFIYSEKGLGDTSALQEAFDGLTELLNQKFPDYGGPDSLLEHWGTCSRYISHVRALTQTFKKFRTARSPYKPLLGHRSFVHLLKKASWFLQEIGEHQESLKLAQLGIDVCDDQTSEMYAYLCNTICVIAVDSNDIFNGEFYSSKALAIREDRLSPDDFDIAISHNNLANALLNQGKFEDCLKHHAISDDIWTGSGHDNDIYRGLSYLNIGRAHSLRGDKPLAGDYYSKAEAILSRLRNKWLFIALQYSWGVLHMNHGDPLTALGKFESALTLTRQYVSTKALVSAIHYKLALVYTRLELPIKETRKHLESAMAIAIHNQRKAEMARIGRQIAIIIRHDLDASDEDRSEAEKHEAFARETRENLWRDIGKHLPVKARSEEEQHDWLVAAYYR